MTDNDFKNLMDMPKRIENKKVILPSFGKLGNPISVASTTTLDTFILDTDRRSRWELSKIKIQERHFTNTPLIRLEINCRPHTNPNGETTSRNHIHVYKEGYGLRWAYDLDGFDDKLFKSTDNFTEIFFDFCRYCNISTEHTTIQGAL